MTDPDGLADVVVLAASLGHPGSVRARALAAGLAARGHRVTAICADGADHTHPVDPAVDVRRTSWLDVVDTAKRLRLKETPVGRPRVADGGVQLSAIRRLEARLAVPDIYVTWIPAARAETLRVTHPRTVVLTTAPVSGHVAARLARTGRPWIADINDLWWGNPHRPAGALRRTLDRRLERWALKGATALTTVNDVLADELRSRYRLPVHTLMNGFDPTEFADTAPPPRAGPVELLWAGTLYPGFDLRPLFAAVAARLADGRIDVGTFRVAFIGGGSDRAHMEAERTGAAPVVSVSAAIERSALLERLSQSDALLLPLYENDPYSLPSRLFEYIGARRPIVALGPQERFTARFVDARGLGVVATTADDVGAVIDRLLLDRTALPVASETTRETLAWSSTADALSALVESVR